MNFSALIKGGSQFFMPYFSVKIWKNSQCNKESDSGSKDPGEPDDANHYNKEIIYEASDQKITASSSPDENGPIFPRFTQLRSERTAVDYRLRKTYF